MKIVCSRQVFTEQTNERTEISISWAPCRSQKLLDLKYVNTRLKTHNIMLFCPKTHNSMLLGKKNQPMFLVLVI